MVDIPPRLLAAVGGHFGVTPGGGRWVSDWVYTHALTAEARAGLVLKEIEYTRNGKKYKRRQWVRASKGDPASAQTPTAATTATAPAVPVVPPPPPPPSPPPPPAFTPAPAPEAPKADAPRPARPKPFASAAEAESHFQSAHKLRVKRGSLSESEFVAHADVLNEEATRLGGMKAVRDAVKRRAATPQTLELGATHLGSQVKGKYTAFKGIEINTGNLTPDAEPVFGGHTVGNDVGSTYRHELGHEVYNTVLSRGKQMEWNKKFQKYVGTSTVSRYGGTNTSELFSESFSAYTSAKYKRGSLPPDVESWLDKHVKGE